MPHAPHHHPPHLFKNNTIYFITARTIDKKLRFNNDKQKRLFCLCLKAGLQNLNIKIYAWVLLSNHYHLLIKINEKENLSKFINYINGKSSYELNKSEDINGRKIWYQYFDRCIHSEKDFWMRFNYIHNNPIKHSYIKNPDKLHLYRFSSYNQWLKKNSKEWIADCFAQYPIVNFTCENDD